MELAALAFFAFMGDMVVTGLCTAIYEQCMDLIFPPECPGCGAWISSSDGVLCGRCWGELQGLIGQEVCPTCGRSTGLYEIHNGQCHYCQGINSHVDYVIRAGVYDGPFKRMIWSLKYCGQSRLDRFLGELMVNAAMARPVFGAADYLVPVPLNWRRRLVRGYNQSELLAKVIAARLNDSGRGIQVRKDLVRILNTPPQTVLAPEKRKQNLSRAFAVRPDAPFAGKSVCLVDDVATTGTTLEACAKVLKNAGVKSVGALVICVPDFDAG